MQKREAASRITYRRTTPDNFPDRISRIIKKFIPHTFFFIQFGLILYFNLRNFVFQKGICQSTLESFCVLKQN